MSVSLRKQRDKPSENRIFKKENKYGNLSIIHHSQRLPKGTFRTAWGGENPVYVHRKSSAPTKELGTNPGAYLCDGADDLCRIGLQTL